MPLCAGAMLARDRLVVGSMMYEMMVRCVKRTVAAAVGESAIFVGRMKCRRATTVVDVSPTQPDYLQIKDRGEHFPRTTHTDKKNMPELDERCELAGCRPFLVRHFRAVAKAHLWYGRLYITPPIRALILPHSRQIAANSAGFLSNLVCPYSALCWWWSWCGSPPGLQVSSNHLDAR